MNPTYNYDEIYGILLNRNKDDTERTYFVLECEYWSFYRWMFMYNWNKARDHPCEINGVRGRKITLRR